jgi:sulfur carrier protein ThiS adenylyltransferase
MDYKRQTALYNPAEHADRRVTLVGAGNIGSHSAIALARMGIKHFTLYDDDIVEIHNLSSQAYRVADIGKKKVEALRELMLEVNTEADIVIHDTLYTGREDTDGILIIAVDSMDTRAHICENVKTKDVYVIDGRMGGGQIEIHAQPAKVWRKTIVAEADTDPCSARYISYTSYIIAGAIANTVKRYILGERDIKRLLLHTNTYELITERYAQK